MSSFCSASFVGRKPLCANTTSLSGLNPVYTIQPAVSCKQTSNRLSNRLSNGFDNRVERTALFVQHGCHGCTTLFDNRFDNRIERTTTVRSTGSRTGLYNRFDNRLYTRYNRLSNRFDNRLYRVNGALGFQPTDTGLFLPLFRLHSLPSSTPSRCTSRYTSRSVLERIFLGVKNLAFKFNVDKIVAYFCSEFSIIINMLLIFCGYQRVRHVAMIFLGRCSGGV